MRHPVGDAPCGQAPDALPPAWGFRVDGWAGTAGGIKNDLTKTSPLRIGADPSTRMSSDSRFLCRSTWGRGGRERAGFFGARPPRAPRPSHDGREKVTRKVAEISLYMGVLGVFSLENGLRYYCTAFTIATKRVRFQESGQRSVYIED